MSYRRQLPQSRRQRRQATHGPEVQLDKSQLHLPVVLRFLTNPKMFAVIGAVMAVALIGSLFVGSLFTGIAPAGDSDVPVRQANELPDVPRDNVSGTPTSSTPDAAPTNIKRYTSAPAMSIDPSKQYTATIKTVKGDIQVQLYPDAAPEAVNAFVFLAQDGYYNGTPFMELVKSADGSRFYAQAGDPTRTGLGTPGFSIKKELTTRPFVRGALGMGGSAENSNGGQFFISYGDYPSLNGKYTIFGQVVSGLDVLDRLSLLDVSAGGSSSSDIVQSVEITETGSTGSTGS
jgi:cyclophilin family peptidyl-prolyl cis-trans isomerase